MIDDIMTGYTIEWNDLTEEAKMNLLRQGFKFPKDHRFTSLSVIYQTIDRLNNKVIENGYTFNGREYNLDECIEV